MPGDLYSLGRSLFDHAIGMAGANDEDEPMNDEVCVPDDGFGDLIGALVASKDREGLVNVLSDAIFDDTTLTFETVLGAAEARSVLLEDLSAIWDEEEDAVNEFAGF